MDIPSKYVCRICSRILRDPVQFPCGHHCCQSCIAPNGRNVSIACSVCQEKAQPNLIFLDRGFRRDMQEARIDCQSCSWAGPVVRFQEHNLPCSNRLVSCALPPLGCAEQNLAEPLLNIIEIIPALSQHSANQVDRSNSQVHRLSPSVQVFEQDRMPTDEIVHDASAIVATSVEESSSDDLVVSDPLSLWKITQMKKQLGHSQSDIFASTLCTLPGDYRMRLSLTVDRSRETLSISLRLVPGDYDAILAWPFHFQMAFSLYHHIRKQNDYLASFRSDRHSTSFQRPQSEMNVPCDIPNFIPLADLKRQNSPYIEDDSILIKILFFKDPVSIDLLPSLMSVNPALPLHFQKSWMEQKRKQEMENAIDHSCSH